MEQAGNHERLPILDAQQQVDNHYPVEGLLKPAPSFETLGIIKETPSDSLDDERRAPHEQMKQNGFWRFGKATDEMFLDIQKNPAMAYTHLTRMQKDKQADGRVLSELSAAAATLSEDRVHGLAKVRVHFARRRGLNNSLEYADQNGQKLTTEDDPDKVPILSPTPNKQRPDRRNQSRTTRGAGRPINKGSAPKPADAEALGGSSEADTAPVRRWRDNSPDPGNNRAARAAAKKSAQPDVVVPVVIGIGEEAEKPEKPAAPVPEAEASNTGNEGAPSATPESEDQRDKGFMAAVGRIANRATIELAYYKDKAREKYNDPRTAKVGKIALGAAGVIGLGLAIYGISKGVDHGGSEVVATPPTGGSGAALPHETLTPPTPGAEAVPPVDTAPAAPKPPTILHKGDTVYGEVIQARGYDMHHLSPEQAVDVNKTVKDIVKNQLNDADPKKLHVGTEITIPPATDVPAAPDVQPKANYHVETLGDYNAKTGHGTFSDAVESYVQQSDYPHLNNSQFNQLVERLLDYDRQARVDMGLVTFEPKAMPKGLDLYLPERLMVEDMIREIIDKSDKVKTGN